MGSLTSPHYGSASHLRFAVLPADTRICLHVTLRAYPRTTIAWAELPSCVTPSLTYYSIRPTTPPAYPAPKDPARGLVVLVSEDSALARTSGYGTINPLSIDYACRPRLRPRLTLGGSACPRNPWSSGARVSHPRIATHACILTRAASTPAHAKASVATRRSPTHPRP